MMSENNMHTFQMTYLCVISLLTSASLSCDPKTSAFSCGKKKEERKRVQKVKEKEKNKKTTGRQNTRKCWR